MNSDEEKLSHISATSYSQISSLNEKEMSNKLKALRRQNSKLKKDFNSLSERFSQVYSENEQNKKIIHEKEEEAQRIEEFYRHEISIMKKMPEKRKYSQQKSQQDQNLDPNIRNSKIKKNVKQKKSEKFEKSQAQRQSQNSIFFKVRSLNKELCKLNLDDACFRCDSLIKKNKNKESKNEQLCGLGDKIKILKEQTLAVDVIKEQQIENAFISIEAQLNLLKKGNLK